MAKTRASISRITSPLADSKGGRLEAEGERVTAKSLVVSLLSSTLYLSPLPPPPYSGEFHINRVEYWLGLQLSKLGINKLRGF